MPPRPRRKSTAKGTKKLKSSDFAYPKSRKYPINTLKRARAALAYAARKDTAGSYSHVAKKVRAKYGAKVKSVGKKRTTRRKRRTSKRRR
jgi:2-hydroxychromene-2-carboxylate isomerase